MNKTRIGSTPSPVKLQKYKDFQAPEPRLYELIVIIGTNFCKANKAKTKKCHFKPPHRKYKNIYPRLKEYELMSPQYA